MITDESGQELEAETESLPDAVADAWAAVLIDVYEKISGREAPEATDDEGTEGASADAPLR